MSAHHDGSRIDEQESRIGIDMPPPATSNQQPATSNQQPATSNQQDIPYRDRQNPDAKRPLIERPFLIWSV
jgi:hypothetical protein